MHIKKLEICGFKSFVDRTVVHFDHDMIGVVGPNGCGKSNIIDSIRWVMGEQSAKALRGKGMGDVIFNGSETRPQGGFAEVTITFDNADPEGAQSLPLEYRDYAEISVTRRLFRGEGSNDYFINKVPVRLRDVTEAFLGTGVGRGAYSIVEQGKIGMIVSARSEDRRTLIEEAAGITKYKARRRQAENKMKLTRGNLLRVTDVVSEIERQLGSLKRQAAKAARYLRYKEEADDLVLWEASHRYLELTSIIRVADLAVTDLTERVAAERAAVDARDAEIEVMRLHAHEAERDAETAQQQAFMSDNEVRQHESAIERALDRYRHLCERLQQAFDEQQELEDKQQQLQYESDGLSEQLEVVERERDEEQALVQADAERLQQLHEQAQLAEQTLSVLRAEHSQATSEIARSEAALGGFQQRHDDMLQRDARLAEELARLNAEHARLNDERQALTEQVSNLSYRKQAMCDARDALQDELPEAKIALASGEERLEETRSALHRDESRLRALQELAERMEGVGAGVRNLLNTGDAALGGLIADRIDVPERYTTALAGLVGDRLQCVIVNDVGRALELLRGLASDRGGRASIIPRTPNNVERPVAAAHATLAGAEGVVGLMVDQLRFHPDDAAAVHALVGDAVLVEGAHHASQLHQRQLSCDIVTLDGTVFHADGRITGGAGDALASGMLEQKREIRELIERVDTLTADYQLVRAEQDRLSARLLHQQEALDQAKAEAHEAEIALVTGEQDLQRLEQQLALVAKRSEEVASEIAQLQTSIERARAEHEDTLAQLTSAQQLAEVVTERLALAEEETLAQRDELARQQAMHTERQVLLASVRERASACRNALQRVERERQDVAQRIASLTHERDNAAHEAGTSAATAVEARAGLMGSRLEARQARAAFESARVGLDDARHTLALQEAEMREMRAHLENTSKSLQDNEMTLQRRSLELEHLEEGVAERFQELEIRLVVGDYHARPLIEDEQRARIRELTQLISRMGSVNLDAMKEYEEQSSRYNYYTEQMSDLENALADLEAAIAQMNRESQRLFKHAFDGINRRFKEIFPKMFRGGKAELRLTNPEDMLDTGVEILAQPPGKRLGNLELMSGGEKAFTAVSLLLAIFRFKPSPFCILDEVDAPLDDANIDRYVEALRAMTDRSQFIVVTHSKRTMQAVDVLYGVTMQEPGVSKLVGVRVAGGETRSTLRRAQQQEKAAQAAKDAARAQKDQRRADEAAPQAAVA